MLVRPSTNSVGECAFQGWIWATLGLFGDFGTGLGHIWPISRVLGLDLRLNWALFRGSGSPMGVSEVLLH